ncbi:MAG: LLM class oxidoreductase [Pseudomonadota bacterium]
MSEITAVARFADINRAYGDVLQPGRLSLGLTVPIEAYSDSPVPSMADHAEMAVLAEDLGFSALWLRDVPFNVPSFGDAGHVYDPFVYLGFLAARTERIALGVASVILPLRHPAHVAKAAASVDVLSGGRLLLGVASGDRPDEYPAMNVPFEDRGRRFRDSFDYIRRAAEPFAAFDNAFGRPHHMDMLPKPSGARLPLLITGGSQQSPDWVARHGDGWITYPRNAETQGALIAAYRNRIAAEGGPDKPVVQSLYIDLLADPDADPRPIHLGFQSGVRYLHRYLTALQTIGVNHVALNLRFSSLPPKDVMRRLAADVLPVFHS